MRPLQLTLTGFIGIRDGLGCDQFSLDLETLVGDAPLVAIVGPNGRGKSTILDNLTPYLVMPSRAGLDGLGAFSYYDEVFLSESSKDLVWSMNGRRYRSQIAIRLGTKRRSEAFLHVDTPRGWHPVRLQDGTVADGRLESYTRCVEVIAGPAAMFFSTAFAAQQRRQLCAYRPAEIKTLLADLLGLHRVKALAESAQETLRLLRAGLTSLRQQHAALEQQATHRMAELQPAATLTRQVDLARQERNIAQARLDQARTALASLQAQHDLATQHTQQRTHLLAERGSAETHGAKLQAELLRLQQAEQHRLSQLDEQRAREIGVRETQRASLRAQQSHLRQLLADAGKVQRAARRLPLQQCIAERRAQIARQGQLQLERFRNQQEQLESKRTSLAELERMAGQAALAETGLRHRLQLTREVPCCGSDLQPRCKLLADARLAQTQLPSAATEIARLANSRAALLREIQPIEDELALCAKVPELSARDERLAQRSHVRWQTTAQLATRAADCARAASLLNEVEGRFDILAREEQQQVQTDAQARQSILARLTELQDAQLDEDHRLNATLARFDSLIAALPAEANSASVQDAQRKCATALLSWQQADANLQAQIDACHAMTHQHQRIGLVRAEQQALAARIERVEHSMADWTLLAKSLGNDGIVALAIDDAGPALSALTNDLLLACYGPRFSVALQTQLETAKGALKEGFEITVHDSESRAAKSLAKMSGGERLWIDACLTRAMALYLAERSGLHSDTLFSDEADGAFDLQRKRQFMAMKREILRLGNYRQEFFISHTPELADAADAIINLNDFATR